MAKRPTKLPPGRGYSIRPIERFDVLHSRPGGTRAGKITPKIHATRFLAARNK